MKLTDEQLRTFMNDDIDFDNEDGLYSHFEEYEKTHDIHEILDEARRVWGLITGEEVDEHSPLDFIFWALLNSGYYRGYRNEEGLEGDDEA